MFEDIFGFMFENFKYVMIAVVVYFIAEIVWIDLMKFIGNFGVSLGIIEWTGNWQPTSKTFLRD